MGALSAAKKIAVVDAPPDTTEFVGYGCVEGSARIVRIKPSSSGRLKLALDRTPFYAESGGQIGDQGTLVVDGVTLTVADTTKQSGIFWHDVATDKMADSLLGKTVWR